VPCIKCELYRSVNYFHAMLAKGLWIHKVINKNDTDIISCDLFVRRFFYSDETIQSNNNNTYKMDNQCQREF
jgi:hypothetical protein